MVSNRPVSFPTMDSIPAPMVLARPATTAAIGRGAAAGSTQRNGRSVVPHRAIVASPVPS